mgnify:CR=1 FL=1
MSCFAAAPPESFPPGRNGGLHRIRLLAGIEQGLLLPLDIGQRLALDNLQFIQRLRALDQFAVLLRAPGGVAGRQPVVEGIAGALSIRPRRIELQLRLIPLVLRHLPRVADADKADDRAVVFVGELSRRKGADLLAQVQPALLAEAVAGGLAGPAVVAQHLEPGVGSGH